MRRMGWTALATAFLLLAHGAHAQPAADNGVIGAMNGEGGDPAEGAALYAQRCAKCHDNPTGRTPAKAVLQGSTRAAISTSLLEGIMAPMAIGLTPKQRSSIAAYLSNRTAGGLSDVRAEAPLCPGKAPPMSLSGPQWNGWGRTAEQSRFQPDPGFKAADAPRLKLKWAFAYPGSRNGQATVVGGRVFLNSYSGAVYALNAQSGCAYWRFDAAAGTRSSIIVGRIPSAKGAARYALYFTDFSRTAYALDAETGAVIWKTRVDDQREVQMTGSPALSGGRLFVTISSAEEAIAVDDAYECCKFRGAVVAVDAANGKVLWKTYMTPGPAKPFKTNAKGVQMYGPAGGAIWSAPTIDTKRGLLYVATGDSYTDQAFPLADAIVALDQRTGAVRWHNQLTQGDNYINGCFGSARRANCPTEPGPDVDFGASPILHTLKSGRQVILAGQKSSQVYALDPDARGKVIWEHRLSGGGPLGGVEFGMAADAQVLYAPVADVFPQPPGKARPQLTAIRIADGKVLWTAEPPRVPCAWRGPFCSPAMSQAASAMPGLVFAGSMDGRFRAFDAATGKVVWETNTADPEVATVSGRMAKGGVLDGAGPTIAGGIVYVNSGYQGRSGAPGNVLLAYSVDGK